MSSRLLSQIDEAIAFVKQMELGTVSNTDDVVLLHAKGYQEQTFATLNTKINEKTTNTSQLPMLGLGTWLSKPGQVATAVEYALKTGYRHIDAAAVYGNEKEVGEGIAAALEAGIKREDIFITSKLWNTKHDPKDVLPALNKSLKDLGLDYVDLYLVHWPLTLKAGDDLFPKKEDGFLDFGRIVSHKDTWAAMEECVRLGLTKHIGVSNFNEEQLQGILDTCKIRPTVNQCEGHPYLAQNEMRKFCEENDIILQAYSPLGNPARPSGWDHSLPRVLDDPDIKTIADSFDVNAADVCIRYQIDRGVVVIPKSVNFKRIKSNFEVWGFILNDEQLEKLGALDKNQRYGIPTVLNDKGQRVIRDGHHPFWPWKDTVYGCYI
eukprot:9776_1